MKIVHIVCAYPPYYSGMGAVVLQTVQALAERGHDVEVLTPLYTTPPGTSPDSFEAPVQQTVDFAMRFAPRIRYGNAAHIPAIKKELDRFDIVHLHYPFFGTAHMVRTWKKKHPDTPLVVTYHMDTRAPGWKGLVFKYYTAFWMPKILASADLLLGSSQEYIEASDAATLYAAAPEKWHAVPFGVDTDRFQPRQKPEDLFQEAGFSLDIPTLLFVGGMDRAHYFKGINVLLKALLRLKKNNINIQAFFVGDGDMRSTYQDRTKGFGLSDRVAFLGRVDDDLLPLVYNAADLLVLPSTSRGEAFGMVLLEAFASGVPVIASDLPGVRSVAEKGGMVVPPGDDRALADAVYEYFFGDSIDSAALKASVRQLAVDEYAWSVIVEEIDRLYQSLVA